MHPSQGFESSATLGLGEDIQEQHSTSERRSIYLHHVIVLPQL